MLPANLEIKMLNFRLIRGKQAPTQWVHIGCLACLLLLRAFRLLCGENVLPTEILQG